MIISLFFYYTGLNVTSCCSWLISFLRVSYTLSCGGADVRMGPAQLAFLLHRMYGIFLFYIGCFLQWKPIFFLISSVSCFHVFPCVHFLRPARLCVAWSNERASGHEIRTRRRRRRRSGMPRWDAKNFISTSCARARLCVAWSNVLFLRPRACVLRDLTNEHNVTEFEQEDEDDDDVGCQDEIPRIDLSRLIRITWNQYRICERTHFSRYQIRYIASGWAISPQCSVVHE